MNPGVRFSSVIDALTDSIQRFGVQRNEDVLESELNYLVNIFDKVGIETTDKWEVLQDNYSKLIYLKELVNFYDMPGEGIFVTSLKKFCESMDHQTRVYLQDIDWDSRESDFRIEGGIIKKCLQKSLERENVYDKLDDVIKAYKILVTVIEDFRGEKCEYHIEPEFIEEFYQPKKRTKI
jgi:hypothetical protein